MMRSSIRIKLDADAKALARVLKPEADDDMARSSIRVWEDCGDLILDIEAEDVVALRAAINSYLRWTKLAIDANETIGVMT